MRRLVFPTIVALGLVMVGSSSASAEDPTPAPTVSAKSTPGKKLCKIADPEMTELSGIAVTKDGFAVVNNGKEGVTPKIYFLNRECKKVKEASFDGTPLDAEDIVLSPDGQTLWVADVGDNNVRNNPADTRPRVALWSIPASGNGDAVIHRVSYPDGDKHDAEALIFDGDGTPLIVTKEIGAAAGIYKPTAALKKNNTTPVPLERVGEITLSATETAGNPIARIGNKTITGGAVANDLSKVVLRTYTDAMEWDVSGGNVLAALKKEPRTTGLPNEPLGEAIAYSADGKLFYTVSDMSGDKEAANHIREYTPATTVAPKSEKSGTSASGDSWYSDLTIDDLTYMVGSIGVLGLLLVGAGVFGIVRFRRSPQGLATASDDLPSGGYPKDAPETELIGVGGAPQRGAAYGSGRQGGAPVYGAQSGPMSGGGGPQYARSTGQPSRSPQQTPVRGPQQAPVRGPQQAPSRGPQQTPVRGPQQTPVRGPQQAPPRSPQQTPPRGPQQAPVRGPQQAPPRNPQQPPPRGPQQTPGRGGSQQQPHRGPQQPSGRSGGGGVHGGQQPRGGQQPPRGPQGKAQRSPGTYDGRPDGR